MFRVKQKKHLEKKEEGLGLAGGEKVVHRE